MAVSELKNTSAFALAGAQWGVKRVIVVKTGGITVRYSAGATVGWCDEAANPISWSLYCSW